MKKLLLVVIFLCAISGINSNANLLQTDDCWAVYDNYKTDDGWALCISYDNYCNSVIEVKVTYQMAYKKNHCDDDWSYSTETRYYNLQPGRRNYPLIGSYSPSYNDCTTRYHVMSVE